MEDEGDVDSNWGRKTVFPGGLNATDASRGTIMLVTFDGIRPGTQIHNQIPGLVFPTYPQVIRPSQGRDVRRAALSNSHSGEEFDPSPLIVEFIAPQDCVRLDAGVDHLSSDIQATLRAFDASGNMVDERTAVIPPGPTDIGTNMSVQVATPIIKRIELSFSNGYAEVIDNLEFPVVSPEVPQGGYYLFVDFIQPSNTATVTGDAILLEVELYEARRTWRPRSVECEISNARGTRTGSLSFHASAPGTYVIGPVMFGPLEEGLNTLKISARDFDGGAGDSTITVHRMPIAGRVVPSVPRVVTPRAAATSLRLDIQETFPGSLAGRDEILIEAFNSDGPWGHGRIRNPLSQPVPHLDLSLSPPYAQGLGKTILTIRAIDLSTGRVLDEIPLPASVTPSQPIVCPDGVPFYVNIPESLLKTLAQSRAAQVIATISGVQPIDPLQVSYGHGTLHFSQSYKASKSFLRIGFTARIDFYAELRPTVDLSQRVFAFNYQIYSPFAEPGRPLTWLRFVPGLNLIAGASWSYIAGLFEKKFTELFKERFRDELTKIANRLVNATAQFFGVDVPSQYLEDVYIVPSEMDVAYCLPSDVFDGLPVTSRN